MISVTLFLLGLGFTASVLLAITAKVFYVYEDPLIEKVEESLLGANCGGCGYAGCGAAAKAVVAGEAKVEVCTAGGFEIAQNVALVMGQTVEEKEPEISGCGCTYGTQDSDLKYTYDGVPDCRAAVLLFGGSKECDIGCLGLGTCVRACPFDALSMGPNNLPLVDKEKCVACGICVEVCPKDIITLTSATKRILADQKTSECTAPCQRSCPAEIDIPEYIRQISAGNYHDAVTVIKEKNPFPLICGWICPAPCEVACRRNLIDQPVTINGLKKFVSTYDMENGLRDLPYIPDGSGKKIAVIGGGIEGLTAAYYLRRLGHSPTVLEATNKLGGILRNVISEDRLPREVLDWEIEGILEMGIEARTETQIGKDFSFESLFSENFDMILLTTGGWDSKQILGGKQFGDGPIPNTTLLLDFLYTAQDNKKQHSAKKVVIVGGGKAALKASQVCLDNGASDITVIYPFDKSEVLNNNMKLIESDNINYIFSAIPTKLRGNDNNLSEISIKTQYGDLVNIPLDYLIIGAGRLPEMMFNKEADNTWEATEILKVIKDEANLGLFAVSEVGRHSDFAGVVVAVGRGRKMARALQLKIDGEPIGPETDVITDEDLLQNIYQITDAENFKAARINSTPEYNLTEEEASQEAARCLNCGLICYSNNLNDRKIPASITYKEFDKV